MGEADAAHGPHTLYGLRQLLVYRTGSEASHSLRPRHAVQLLRRGLESAAVCDRAWQDVAGARRGYGRSDDGDLYAAGHDAYAPDVAAGLRAQSCRWMGR